MNSIDNSINQSLLLDRGIILQSGSICQDKINSLSGAITAPLIETIWIFSEHDTKVIERVSAIFAHLYNQGHESEMMDILHILYDILGLQFPRDVELLADHRPGNTSCSHFYLIWRSV